MLKVTYDTAVSTNAGWRNKLVTATAEYTSDSKKRVVILSAEMDNKGESKRQNFNPSYWAGFEIGKVKNVSSLKSVEEI